MKNAILIIILIALIGLLIFLLRFLFVKTDKPKSQKSMMIVFVSILVDAMAIAIIGYNIFINSKDSLISPGNPQEETEEVHEIEEEQQKYSDLENAVIITRSKIYCDEKEVDIIQLENYLSEKYRQGVEVNIVDYYADSEMYHNILKLLDKTGVKYNKIYGE